jgi:hypothetical protein
MINPSPIPEFVVSQVKPYVPPTDKEIIEKLEFLDNYEAAFLIATLKKENAKLKRKLTILKKKYETLYNKNE